MNWPMVAILAGALLLWAWFCRFLLSNPRGDVGTGVVFSVGRAYLSLVHKVRIEGLEHVPRTRDAGPLIVVANHTAGVDPLLVQAHCPFFIRWMMAEDMRLPGLEWFWRWIDVISIDRDRGQLSSVRDAIRHVKTGGVLGIFPEGGLERPARQIRPFYAGAAMIIHKSGAPVLPVVISDTPQVDPAWASLWHPSRPRLAFKAPIDYADTGLNAEQIGADLQRRFVEWTGWPLNPEPAEVFGGGKSGRP